MAADNRIALLMSGGADSSAAALLLKQAGRQVTGLTFLLPQADGTLKELPEAAALAEQLGIEHHYVSVSEAFERYVTGPFRAEYACGRTPCPCADCNTHIKFGVMYEYAEKVLGIEKMATGHYVRAFVTGGEGHLAMGADRAKDQSYFLYGIKKALLKNLCFPLEGITKEQVRAIAAAAGLAVPSGESMELCFAGEGNYRAAVRAEKPGNIVHTSGRVFKAHEGIENYTIGQRKGLGIAYTAPLYVVEIDAAANTVVLGEYHEGLTDTIEADCLNILEPQLAVPGGRLFGKIRSTGRPKACHIDCIGDDGIRVVFDEEFFVTSPGQKVVLYDCDGLVVMGGTIRECVRKVLC